MTRTIFHCGSVAGRASITGENLLPPFLLSLLSGPAARTETTFITFYSELEAPTALVNMA